MNKNRFYQLLESELGNVKTLINEQVSDVPTTLKNKGYVISQVPNRLKQIVSNAELEEPKSYYINSENGVQLVAGAGTKILLIVAPKGSQIGYGYYDIKDIEQYL